MASIMRENGIVGNYSIIYLKFEIYIRAYSVLRVVWNFSMSILNIAGAN